MIQSSPVWELELQACGPPQPALYAHPQVRFQGETDMNRQASWSDRSKLTRGRLQGPKDVRLRAEVKTTIEAQANFEPQYSLWRGRFTRKPRL
jgi:hypothetical protein